VLALGTALVFAGRRGAAAVARFELAMPPATDAIIQTEISPDGQRLAIVAEGEDG
jgi:hypothetical protein